MVFLSFSFSFPRRVYVPRRSSRSLTFFRLKAGFLRDSGYTQSVLSLRHRAQAGLARQHLSFRARHETHERASRSGGTGSDMDGWRRGWIYCAMGFGPILLVSLFHLCSSWRVPHGDLTRRGVRCRRDKVDKSRGHGRTDFAPRSEGDVVGDDVMTWTTPVDLLLASLVSPRLGRHAHVLVDVTFRCQRRFDSGRQRTVAFGGA